MNESRYYVAVRSLMGSAIMSQFGRTLVISQRCEMTSLQRSWESTNLREYDVINGRHTDLIVTLSQCQIVCWETIIDAKSINQFNSQLKIYLNNIIRGLHKSLAFYLFPTLLKPKLKS